MKSAVRGKNTSEAEVQDVSRKGIWIYVRGKEYFLPHKTYPWFEHATVSQIYRLQLLHGDHLYWPDLDVDLELESLDHPERYPLIYRQKDACSRSQAVKEPRRRGYGKRRTRK